MNLIKVPLRVEDIANIQKSYGEMVAEYCRKAPSNKISNGINLKHMQEMVNEYAMSIYDKHGRCIIRVGQDDFIDITCPIVGFDKEKVMVTFMDTDSKGTPLRDPNKLG